MEQNLVNLKEHHATIKIMCFTQFNNELINLCDYQYICVLIKTETLSQFTSFSEFKFSSRIKFHDVLINKKLMNLIRIFFHYACVYGMSEKQWNSDVKTSRYLIKRKL